MSERRVAVVGAGLAGCEAADRLTRHGIAVDLFEMKPQRREAELAASAAAPADPALERAVEKLAQAERGEDQDAERACELRRQKGREQAAEQVRKRQRGRADRADREKGRARNLDARRPIGKAGREGVHRRGQREQKGRQRGPQQFLHRNSPLCRIL